MYAKDIDLTVLNDLSLAQIQSETDPINGLIVALNDLSVAQIQTETSIIIGNIAALNDLSVAQIQGETDPINTLAAAVKVATDKLNFTGANIQANVQNKGILNDLSVAQVNTEVDNALNSAIPANPTAESINDVIKKVEWFQQLNGIDYIIGDNLIHSNDTEDTAISQSWIKVKDIDCHISGTMRISFDLRSTNNFTIVHGKIYKNDGGLGTDQSSTSENYATKSEDLVFADNDTLELWIRTEDGTYPVYCRNFRIYGLQTDRFENTIE